MLTLYSRIVVPYDHSELGKKALKYAKTLAGQDHQIELYVVMVVNPETTVSYQGEFMHEEAEEIRDFVEQELKGLPNKTRTFVLEGHPASMIIDFVKQNDGDFIVMGSRGLSGLKEVFLGSVSHHVVQQAPCPVLVVK